MRADGERVEKACQQMGIGNRQYYEWKRQLLAKKLGHKITEADLSLQEENVSLRNTIVELHLKNGQLRRRLAKR